VRGIFEFEFEAVGRVCGRQGVDGIDGGGEEDGFSLRQAGITKSRGEMGFSEADAAQEDDIGLIIEELQAEEVLHGSAVDRFRVIPAELVQGFYDREPCHGDSTLNGAIMAQGGLSLGEAGQVIHMRPVLGGSLAG